MPLNRRITFATQTLQEFVALTPGKKKILIFLLARWNRRTNYFSHADIAEETGLKETTIRVSLASLEKEGWITQTTQRKKYTPKGKPETQFKWRITKDIKTE